jgi:hypothetical protein
MTFLGFPKIHLPDLVVHDMLHHIVEEHFHADANFCRGKYGRRSNPAPVRITIHWRKNPIEHPIQEGDFAVQHLPQKVAQKNTALALDPRVCYLHLQ